MYIIRDNERKLAQLQRLYPVVLVTGPRQTGKSSLVRHFFPNHRYVSLDQAALVSQATEDPGLFILNYPAPVVFDEVQRVPKLLQEIKFVIDRNPEMRAQYVLTGSQPLPLMHAVSESLAGRIGILELPPMTLAEIFDAPGRPRLLSDWQDNPPVGETFPYERPPIECLLRGGFPAMALPQYSLGIDDACQRLRDYVQTYLVRDLRDLAQVDDIGRFERFMRLVAASSGRLLNLTEVAQLAGIPQSTADDWLGLLEASQIVWRAAGFSRKMGRREAKRSKIYLCDSGLHLNLLGYTETSQVMASPLSGSVFETAAANAIRRITTTSASAPQIFHWRSSEKDEVDMVIELTPEKLCAVEFKMTSAPKADDTQGLVSFMEKYPGSVGIIASTSPTCFWVTRSILNIPWSAV